MKTSNPDVLLDSVITKLNLKNDAALARSLQVAPPVISKIRSGRLPVGSSFLCRLHEASGISIASLRTLGGIPPILKSTAA